MFLWGHPLSFVLSYAAENIDILLQVVASDTQMYSLEIGPWMDIAFITICASAIDLLHVRARLSPWDNVCHLITSLGCQDDTEHDIAVQTNVI